MRYRVLGRLAVVDDQGRPVDLGGQQPRTTLAMLLAARGRIVSVDTLIEGVWRGAPAASAPGALQSYISRLRRSLEPDRAPGAPSGVIASDPPGYRLLVDPDDVDYLRFERLADHGRDLLAEGAVEQARDVLLEADRLWDGPAFVEFAADDWASGTATRLEERRLAAIEDRIQAELALGRHATVVTELPELVAAHPLREVLREQLALALYRCGRQADALRALSDARATLVEQLGIDPGRRLQDLEAGILAHDPLLDGGAPAAASLPPALQTVNIPAESPLVGRDTELALLTHALTEALGGRTSFAIVEGEPGIGKTALLEALAARASERGAAVVWGRGHEGGGGPAFWPWLNVLRGLVRTMPQDQRVHAEGVLAPLLSPQPVMAGGGGSPGDTFEAGRFQLFQSIGEVVQDTASRQPAVVLLDDLQWADPASLGLLEFVAHHLDSAPVLVVAAVRELERGRNDDVVAALAAVMRRSGTPRLALRGLGAGDVADLAERVAGHRLAGDAMRAMQERSDGNPLFVTQLAQLLSGGTASQAGRDAVPEGVRDVVRRRLAGLPDATAELLPAAAVLGRDVDVRLLAATAAVSIDTCLDGIEPAVASRLLLPDPEQPAVFRFAHALVREVVLADLTPLLRIRLHARAADAYRATFGDGDDTIEIVAEHLWAAVAMGLEREAAAALERAADVAQRRFAYEAADDRLERAVRLRRSTGATPADLEAELLAITRLAALRRMRYGYRRAAEVAPIDRARELAGRTGRHDVLAGLLWAEWAAASTGSDFVAAAELATQLQQLGESSGDPALRALGHCAAGGVAWQTGRLDEAATELAAAIAAQDEAFAQATGMPDPAVLESAVVARSFALFVDEVRGVVTDGHARFAEMARFFDHPLALVVVHAFDVVAAAALGDAARAERGCQKVLDAAGHSHGFFGSGAAMYKGWAMAQRGEAAAGLELFLEGKERFLASHGRTVLGLHLAHEATILAALGRLEEAVAAIAAAHDEAASTGERYVVPLVLLHEASVQAGNGASVNEVTALLAAARDEAVSQGAHAIAARVDREGEALVRASSRRSLDPTA